MGQTVQVDKAEHEEAATKAERTRAALRQLVVATLDAGLKDGLRPEAVQAVKVGLEALGWLPSDLRRA